MALALEAVSLLEKTAVTKEALEVFVQAIAISLQISEGFLSSYMCFNAYRQLVWESW